MLYRDSVIKGLWLWDFSATDIMIITPPPVCLSVCLPVCLSVCLSVREHISRTTHPIFPIFFVHTHSLALLWRRWDTFVVCTSGFMDDVICITSHMSIPLQRVTSLRCHAQANTPAASYWPRRVLDYGARWDVSSQSCAVVPEPAICTTDLHCCVQPTQHTSSLVASVRPIWDELSL